MKLLANDSLRNGAPKSLHLIFLILNFFPWNIQAFQLAILIEYSSNNFHRKCLLVFKQQQMKEQAPNMTHNGK